MGASLSAEGKTFLLDCMFGDDTIPGKPGDAFNKHLTSLQHTILADDHYDYCRTTLLERLPNNLETHNIELFLHHTWSSLDHAVCNRNGTDPILCAALRASHNLLRLCIEFSKGDVLMLLKLVDNDGISTKLVLLLMEFVVQVPVDATTCRMHCEVLLLLLTYASTALHHTPEYRPECKDMYIERMLASDVIEGFTLALVNMFVAWGNNLLPTSQYFYMGGAQPSLFNLYYLFGTVNRQKRVDMPQLLGHLSLEVLLAVSFYQKRVIAENIAAVSLTQLVDGEQVSFSLLLTAVKEKIADFPEVMMLLYHLLTSHKTFFATVLQAFPNEFKEVVSGLLYNLSEGLSEAVQHMAATCLLIISQEASLVSNMFSWQTTINWFTARKGVPKFIGKCSVGSIAVVCLSKTASRALFSNTLNYGLASICLGVLANMAPFIHHIEPYPAQRMMAVFSNVTRKVSKLHKQLQSTPDAYSLAAELDELVNTATILAEILYVAVSGQGADKQNFPLLYEILYSKDHLVTAEGEQHPRIIEALSPVVHLASFYETELASVSENHTSDEIINIIKRVSEDDAMVEVVASSGNQAKTDHFDAVKRSYEDLFFCYEEADNCYVFFGSFLWQQVAFYKNEKALSNTFKWLEDGAMPAVVQAHTTIGARRANQ